MSKENLAKLMAILARNLDQQVLSIDLTKSFDDNGGDSIMLMSTMTDLKKMNWMVPLNLFEPPHILQDVAQHIDDSSNQQATANFKIERFADVQDKDELIDMCNRCFAERSVLEPLVNANAPDLLLSKSAADIDQKRSLSLVVFDTKAKRYIGGAFVHDFIENDYRFSEAIKPVIEIIEDLKNPFQQESDTSNLLYISMRYAEPNLSAAMHIEIFQQLMTAVIDVAKKNNFRGIVSVSTSPVTAVSYIEIIRYLL